MSKRIKASLFWCVLSICLCGFLAASSVDEVTRPHAGMLRYPDVSGSEIVFVYANDLWTVSREGGLARPLASPPGPEESPRFSPDGRTIAFVGNYDGNRDLYTIPVNGGVPTRVTYHPAAEALSDWTPDGQLLFNTNAFSPLSRMLMLHTTKAEGGLPEKLPVPYGGVGAISPDGEWLAYTPHTRDQRTWKRYRGGMATDIWLFHLTRHESKKITDWEGTDTQPMWNGETVYYLSDQGPSHKLNIWSYDTGNGRRRQVTEFSDFDVKWPAIGPGSRGRGEIVFQHGSDLLALDLRSNKTRTVEVSIPGDRPEIRTRTVDVKSLISNANISSTGKRALVEARGDIWTLPAKNGSPRNLTRSSGAAERNPAWSPDGRWIAYFSDAGGEYDLFIRSADGKEDARQLTRTGEGFLTRPVWSPDSKMIAFGDNGGRFYLHEIDGETKLVDTDPTSNAPRANWSHDSSWITYTRSTDDSLMSAIYLYDVKSGEKHQVTGGMFNDSWPTFDRKGDFLYFASNRDFSAPLYEDLGTTFIYTQTDRLYVVPLRNDVDSPLAPKSDEETVKEDEKDEEKGEEKSEGSETEGEESEESDSESEEESLQIDLDGFERRAVQIPVKSGAFTWLSVNHKGNLLYVRGGLGRQGQPSIKLVDVNSEEVEEKTVLDGSGFLVISSDGKKILVRQRQKMAIVDPAPKQKLDKPVSLSGLNTSIQPREEWKQIFTDAWRIQRDYFYDPNMHGVDWPDIRQRYAAMLDDCVTRDDVSYVIREMISEINVGHAYYRGGGDGESQPRVSVGMLGAQFELSEGSYRIGRIIEGAAWDADARGPLSQPGVDVKEGDYLLAVNGVPVDASKDPWASFQGLAGKTVTLTVGASPTLDGDAREVIVDTPPSERNLRYREWIEKNRAYVDEKSGGKVGYIYVPDTGINGQNNLIRQFYGQTQKEALIIDERWNGGGQIPTRFIELLNRPVTNYWAVRHGRDWAWPPDAHQGPKCMLINGLAGSGGDAFPAYFRQAGLGKLIGTRTWGGLVGISGNPRLIDGGAVTAPTFAYYETDGSWGIEGHGVDPDIEVTDDPAKMVGGQDPQLDFAIQHMLDEIAKNGHKKPQRPGYPDRSGMGIKKKDM